MRILCLHGMGTNSQVSCDFVILIPLLEANVPYQIFMMQTGQLTYQCLSVTTPAANKTLGFITRQPCTKTFQSTAGLRGQLGEPHVNTFEFVEGGVDSPAAPGE